MIGLSIAIILSSLAILGLFTILNITIVSSLRERHSEYLEDKFKNAGMKNLFLIRNPIRDIKLATFVFTKRSTELLPDQKTVIYIQRILLILFVIGIISAVLLPE